MKNYYISTLAFLATLISLGLPSNIISMEKKQKEKDKQKQKEISPEYFENLDDVTIIDEIFTKLRCTDLLNLSRTSKRMKSLVNEYIPKYKEKLNKRLDELYKRGPELTKIWMSCAPRSDIVKAGDELEIVKEQIRNITTELTALGTQYSKWTTRQLSDQLQKITELLCHAFHRNSGEPGEQYHERTSREKLPLIVKQNFIQAELKKRGAKY